MGCFVNSDAQQYHSRAVFAWKFAFAWQAEYLVILACHFAHTLFYLFDIRLKSTWGR